MILRLNYKEYPYKVGIPLRCIPHQVSIKHYDNMSHIHLHSIISPVYKTKNSVIIFFCCYFFSPLSN